MNTNISPSRRAVVKGAAWSAPVVLASVTIPAYAASQLSYWAAQSISAIRNYSYTNNKWYTDIFTSKAVGVERPGFTIGYTEGNGKDATATLTRLDFYIAIPASLDQYGANNFNTNVSGLWTTPTRVYNEKLKLSDYDGGGILDTTNLHVYKMSYTGNKTAKVNVDAKTVTWPNTMVSLRFWSKYANYSYFYGGYVTSFILDNGYSETNTSLIADMNIQE